jgi:hypothetical protein
VKVEPLNFRREDISDLSKGQDIERLFRGLNTFGSSAGQALASGLTFTDNMQAFVKEFDVTMGSSSVTLTAQGLWSVSSTGLFARKGADGRVQIEGFCNRNAAASASTVCVLPAGYLPRQQRSFVASSDAQPVRIIVQTSGNVDAVWGAGVPTVVGLDGVIFTPSDERSGPRPGFPVQFTNELAGKAKPAGCWVWSATDTTDKRSAPVCAGPVAWELSSKGDQIVVRDIANLAPERKYRVRVVVVAG